MPPGFSMKTDQKYLAFTKIYWASKSISLHKKWSFFSIKNFFDKCDQICDFLRVWSHLLKNFSMKNLYLVKWLETIYWHGFISFLQVSINSYRKFIQDHQHPLEKCLQRILFVMYTRKFCNFIKSKFCSTSSADDFSKL